MYYFERFSFSAFMGGFLLRYFPGSTCRCHWLFSPGSEGSEGISSLALSPNRKFLAVTRRLLLGAEDVALEDAKRLKETR